jgi:hypothetical protein
MKKKVKIKVPRPKPRNPVALPAKQRKAGPLKDRRKPKGGATNIHRKLLEKLDEE